LQEEVNPKEGTGSGAGIGAVIGALITGYARNPSLKAQLFNYARLGVELIVEDKTGNTNHTSTFDRYQ